MKPIELPCDKMTEVDYDSYLLMITLAKASGFAPDGRQLCEPKNWFTFGFRPTC